MTANQINYAKVLEDTRHNKVTETQKLQELGVLDRQATTAERQAAVAELRQREDQRHNQQQEAINWWQATEPLKETARHNRVVEEQNASQIASQIQLNAAQSEATLRQAGAAEKRAGADVTRAYAALQSAGASQLGAQASMLGASASQAQVMVRESELAEAIRKNMAAQEEINRHNRILESQQSYQNVSGRIAANAQASQADTAKHRATSERIKAVSKAVDTGVNVTKQLSTAALSILGGLS